MSAKLIIVGILPLEQVKKDVGPSLLSSLKVVSAHPEPLTCACALLMYTASVLGTTPRGDTGEGPNWACKRLSAGNSNDTCLSAPDRSTPYAVQ